MRKVLHLMGSLNDEDVEWLIGHGQPRTMAPRAVVIRQGEPIDALMILLDGQLSVRFEDDREIAALYPGEVLGEISFVDSRPPSATVVAVHESHLLAIGREPFQRKLARDDGFAARFYRALAVFLADRLRTTTAHLGYGRWSSDAEAPPDAIEDDAFDEISMAARRFDDMLRRLRIAT